MAGLEFVVEAVRKTRAGLPDHLPLIGFAGAPFTLAAYAVEGGASRDYRLTKSLMYTDAGAWDALAGRMARAVALYLNAQIDAGAQAVQLFDSWVGCLGVGRLSALRVAAQPGGVRGPAGPACRRSILPRATRPCCPC